MTIFEDKYTVIPCCDDVDVVFPYRDEETKEIEIDRLPVIAWKVNYTETDFDNNVAICVPICCDYIDSLSDTIIFYHKRGIWIRPELSRGQGLDTFQKECEEIVKTIELRNNTQGLLRTPPNAKTTNTTN